MPRGREECTADTDDGEDVTMAARVIKMINFW